MRKNLFVILLLLLTATWAIGQKAPEKERPKKEIEQKTTEKMLYKDIGEATTIDLSYFKTKQIPQNSPPKGGNLNEGFEEPGCLDMDANGMTPTGWKIINGGGTNTWVRATANKISGTASASITYNSVAHDDWLITPRLMPTAGNNTISFKAKHVTSWTEEFYVWVSTSGNNKENFTQIAGPITTQNTPQTYQYNLSAYNDQVIYFAVQATGQNRYYFIVDDFEGPPIYVPPTDLVVTGGNKDYRLIPIGQLESALTLKTFVKNVGTVLTTDVTVTKKS